MMLGQAPIFGEFYLEYFQTKVFSKSLTKGLYPELKPAQLHQFEETEIICRNIQAMFPILAFHNHTYLF